MLPLFYFLLNAHVMYSMMMIEMFVFAYAHYISILTSNKIYSNSLDKYAKNVMKNTIQPLIIRAEKSIIEKFQAGIGGNN